MALGSIALSMSLVSLDHRAGSDRWQGGWWLYGGGAAGARAVLSVIASSMITVAGVVFSVMMVVLSLAAQQYGPRLLRNFMRDRVTQSVLGVFVATFLYCLMVLRTVRGTDQDQFVPHFSVSTGVLLALTSLAMLIYFIHHVSMAIHVAEIIERVQEELLEAIDSVFPEQVGKDRPDAARNEIAVHLPADFAGGSVGVFADSTGYVQAFDDAKLLACAKQHDLVLFLKVQPGDFILPAQLLICAWPRQRVDDETQTTLRATVMIGRLRTPVQDVLFALEQQVDLAVRALSPGINDPFTANSSLDRLAEALSRLAERRVPSALRYDEDQQLRVIAEPISFRRMIENSLGLVREYARGHAIVTTKILNVISRLAPRMRRAEERQALADALQAIINEDYAGLSAHELANLRAKQEQVKRDLERQATDSEVD